MELVFKELTCCIGCGFNVPHRVLLERFDELVIARHFSGMRLENQLNFVVYAQLGVSLAFCVDVGVALGPTIHFAVTLGLFRAFRGKNRGRALRFAAAAHV